MLNLVKYNNNSRKIHIEGYSLLIVAHANELKNEQLEYLDGFIIDTESVAFAKDIIYQIRTNNDLKIALLPIFVSAIHKLPKNVEIHTDGPVAIDLIGSYVQRIATISKKINKLQIPQKATHEEFLNYKVLAYSYTRNLVITPITSRHSLIGYEFPFISLLFKEHEMISLLKTFEKLVQEKLLSFTLQDLVHLCKSCSGSYINFRECCPKCDSIDIKAHDMVHHFVCAHVAPEKDFKIDDGLECPKCDKRLRHIGIDYDKPSTIYSCNTCNHEFQNSSMKGLCIDCSTEHELDELLEKTIGNYSLTQKGENEVLKLQKNTENKVSDAIGNLSLPLFKILLKQEIQRIKTTDCSSYMVTINVKNKRLQLLNSDVKNELTKEIHNIIKSYLKDADMLASKSYDCHYLLLPETKEHQLTRLKNIQYNLNKLLSDNMQEACNEIEIHYEKITTEKAIHEYLI
ncbi:TackOD1 domain-containing protein [Tenacibaculum sp. 190130A14a]|uniref:TackOD1 domain-containing protein n=1 Tax=Tenacibaculum polynesiense TaxID=3137857 RepID=A0ABP1F739_9FLAO